jgi:hypothetical protein
MPFWTGLFMMLIESISRENRCVNENQKSRCRKKQNKNGNINININIEIKMMMIKKVDRGDDDQNDDKKTG